MDTQYDVSSPPPSSHKLSFKAQASFDSFLQHLLTDFVHTAANRKKYILCSHCSQHVLQFSLIMEEEVAKTGSDVRATYCYGCGFGVGKTQKCCRCKIVGYCSKQCQIDHWESHKEGCRLMKKTRRDNKHLRDFRLFVRWLDKASIASSIFCCYEENNNRVQKKKRLDPSKEVYRFQVDFDFNVLNFLPVSPPSLISIDSLTKNQIALVMATARENPNVYELGAVALVTFKGVELPIPIDHIADYDFNISLQDSPAASDWFWESIVFHAFSSLVLKSRRVATLKLPARRLKLAINLKKCVRPLITHELLSHFLSNALHLPSKKPKHHSHAVLVSFTIDSGLGQIASIEAFDVLDIRQIYTLMKYRYDKFSPDFAEVASEDPPQVMDFASKELVSQGGVYEVPVVFLEKRQHAHAIVPRVTVKMDLKTKIWPVSKRHKCDQAAKRYFEQLKAIELPKVKSPNLNGPVEDIEGQK